MLRLACSLFAVAVTASGGGAEPLPPADCVSRVRDARIQEMLGNPSEAEALLRKAVETYPKEIFPLSALLAFERRRKSGADAIAPVRDLLRARLLDPEAAIPSAVAVQLIEDPNLASDDLGALESALDARAAKAPSDTTLLDALLRVQIKLGHVPAARATVDRLLAVERTSWWLGQAYALDARLERWDAAIAELRELGGEQPNNGIRLSLVQALADAGRFDEMEKEMAPLVAAGLLKPAWAGGVYARAAWARRDAGDDAAAQDLFRHALAVDPSNADASAALLYLYATGEERARTLATLTAAWQKETDPFKLLSEGSARLVAGDAATSEGMLARAVELNPANELAWYNLGLAQMRLEKWADAEKALSRAREINPGRSETLLQLGRALHKQKHCAQAIEPLQASLALKPGQAAVHFELYACYTELGETAAAQEQLAKYQALKGSK